MRGITILWELFDVPKPLLMIDRLGRLGGLGRLSRQWTEIGCEYVALLQAVICE